MKKLFSFFFCALVAITASAYVNYKETSNCKDAIVVYEGDDDYYIVQTANGNCSIIERRSGAYLSKGQKIRGEITKTGTKYIIRKKDEREVKIYVEDYWLDFSDAIQWLKDNDHY